MPTHHLTGRIAATALLLALTTALAQAGNAQGRMGVSLTILPGCSSITADAVPQLRCTPGLAYAVSRQRSVPDQRWQAAAQEWLQAEGDVFAAQALRSVNSAPAETLQIDY